MSPTEEYMERARTALDQLRTEIDAFRVQADLGEAEIRERFHQGIHTLRGLQQDAYERLDQVQAATVDGWHQIAEQVENAITTTGDAYERLVNEWKSVTGPASLAARAGLDTFRTEWNRQRAERKQLIDKIDKK